MDTVWQSLLDTIIKAHGETEAGDFDAMISAHRSAIDATDASMLKSAAIDQLDQVDVFEALFATTSDPAD